MKQTADRPRASNTGFSSLGCVQSTFTVEPCFQGSVLVGASPPAEGASACAVEERVVASAEKQQLVTGVMEMVKMQRALASTSKKEGAGALTVAG